MNNNRNDRHRSGADLRPSLKFLQDPSTHPSKSAFLIGETISRVNKLLKLILRIITEMNGLGRKSCEL